MINEMSLPKYFWSNVINTACNVLNKVIIQSIIEKTPYETLKGRKPNLSYFCVFGCKFFILNHGKDNLGKFHSKSDEGIFLGYSSTSKSYRVYNHRTASVEKSMHVSFDESSPQKMGNGICYDVSGIITEKIIDDESYKEDHTPSTKDEDIMKDKEESLHEDEKQETLNQLPQDWRIANDHPLDQIRETSKGE